MQLFLIRHGQSFNNALKDVTARVADPELTERGVEQARLVAAHLAAGGHLRSSERDSGPKLDELYCSPMIRALQTAEPIARVLGLTPHVRTDIHEIGGIYLDNGDGTATGFPGCTREEIAGRFSGFACDVIGECGWWLGGKETPGEGRGRALAAAAELTARSGEPLRVGVVSHGDFMSALIKALANHLPSWGLQYHHENTAITRIDFDDGVVVEYMNRADHLPALLLSH